MTSTTEQHLAEPMNQAPSASASEREFSDLVDEIKSLLDLAYRFKSTSRAAQENIGAACDLLDKLKPSHTEFEFSMLRKELNAAYETAVKYKRLSEQVTQ